MDSRIDPHEILLETHSHISLGFEKENFGVQVSVTVHLDISHSVACNCSFSQNTQLQLDGEELTGLLIGI